MDTTIKEAVREKYAEAARARQVTTTGKASCCGTGRRSVDPITSNLYGADEAGAVPDTAIAASLGCGNPTALIELEQGQTVLDLGHERRNRAGTAAAQGRRAPPKPAARRR